MVNREIEAKFLEIDKEALIAKLKTFGSEDLGEDFLREMIFYDAAGKWVGEGKTFVRIRQTRDGARLTYKNLEAAMATGTEEIEFGIDNAGKAKDFLAKLGLVLHREQEKRRHTFKLGEVIVDIDTWPKAPTYVELEGPSEEAIKEAAERLGYDWSKAVFGNARLVLEKYYKIPIGKLKYFTFERVG